MEPLYKGHFGTSIFVFNRDVSSSQKKSSFGAKKLVLYNLLYYGGVSYCVLNMHGMSFIGPVPLCIYRELYNTVDTPDKFVHKYPNSRHITVAAAGVMSS